MRAQGSAEAAQLERADVLALDAPLGQPVRGVADQDLAGPGGLLQPRRDVDGLAGREGRVGLVDDDLACLDPDARLDTRAVGVVHDPERGTDGALCVVLMRLRDAESGHDGVARELLHGAAMRLDAARHRVEPGRHTTACDLRILGRDELGRADEICEQDGCELAFHTSILGMAVDATENFEGRPEAALDRDQRPNAERGTVASTCCW